MQSEVIKKFIDYKPSTDSVKYSPETYRFVASNIKGCYISWSRSLPSGEVRVGDKIYLIVPNGWDERLQYYPWYTGHIYWQYNQWDYPEQNYENTSTTPKGARNNESVYRYYHGNESNLNVYINRNRFTDKLLIWYKDYYPLVEAKDDIIPTIDNPSAPTDKRTKIRLKIFVQNDNDIITFSPKVLVPEEASVTYSYDFGDGSLGVYTQKNSSDTISHKYTSAGYYVVDVNIMATSDNMGRNRISLEGRGIATSNNSKNVLRSLYIDSPYALVSSRVYLEDYSDLSYVYIKVPMTHLSFSAEGTTNIDNLYLIVSDDDDAIGGRVSLHNSDSSHINNIHLNSNIHKVNVPEFKYANVDSMYLYSSHPVRFVDYTLYDYINGIYDFSNISTNFNLYARASVINKMKDLNKGLNVNTF